MLYQSKIICERAANQLDTRMEILITSTDNLSFNFLSFNLFFVCKVSGKKTFQCGYAIIKWYEGKETKNICRSVN